MRAKKSSTPKKKKLAGRVDLAGIRSVEGRLDASFARFSIVATQWFEEILDPLIAGELQVLREAGAQDKDITLIRVPGAFELPLAL